MKIFLLEFFRPALLVMTSLHLASLSALEETFIAQNINNSYLVHSLVAFVKKRMCYKRDTHIMCPLQRFGIMSIHPSNYE